MTCTLAVEYLGATMNDEAPTRPQSATGKSSWLFTAVYCSYFVLGGWAVCKTVPVFATLLAGQGFSISPDSLLFHMLLNLNYIWLVGAVVAIFVALVIAKHVGYFSARSRRLVNLVLIVAAVGAAPMLGLALAITLSGPFTIIGKLPK